MNNRNVDIVGHVDTANQRDREFEELLCLAYLFTHSVYAEFPVGDSDLPCADDADLYQDYFCN
jgi:hypothetical protein